MLEDFKKRGLNRVLLFVTDGLKGIKEKLDEAFPKAKYQTCWTHVIRNILLKVRSKDKGENIRRFKSGVSSIDKR